MTNGRHSDQQGVLTVDGSRRNHITGGFTDRHLFAGENSFDHAADTLGNLSITGNGFTGGNANQVPRQQQLDRNRLLFIAVQSPGCHRQQLAERFGSHVIAMANPHLEISPQQ